LYNSKLYYIAIINASEITSSTPLRGSKPGTNSLIVIVCSGRVWLQHKASCYRGHGYPNRLSSLQGLHYCYPTRSDLQGGVHLVRECPTEAIRYAEVHPSSSTERPSAGLNPKYKGTLDPCPLYSCTVRGWPVKQTHLPLPE
jgi:hypothetical protein